MNSGITCCALVAGLIASQCAQPHEIDGWKAYCTIETASQVVDVSFSRTARQLAVVEWLKRTVIWDTVGCEQQSALDRPTGVDRAAFCGEGTTLVTARSSEVSIWDMRDQRVSRSIKLDGVNDLTELVCSPDGRLLALCGAARERDEKTGWQRGVLMLWRLDGTEPGTLTMRHPQIVHRISLAGAREWIASACADGFIRIWSTRSGALVHEIRAPGVYSVAFSPDGTTLASGHRDPLDGSGAAVKLWHVATGQELRSFEGHRRELGGAGASVYSLTFAPDGSWLASGGADDKVRIWEVASGRQSAVLPHPGNVFRVEFSPDGRLLAVGGRAVAGSGRGTCVVWRRENDEQ